MACDGMEYQNATDYSGADCQSGDGGDMAERRVQRDDIWERRMGTGWGDGLRGGHSKSPGTAEQDQDG